MRRSVSPTGVAPAVRVVEDGQVCVRALAGEIDLGSVGGLHERLLRTVPRTARGVIIDFTDVTFLDSTGVSLLFEVRRDLRSRNQVVALVLPDWSVLWRLFNITQLPAIVPVAFTLDEAKALIGAR